MDVSKTRHLGHGGCVCGSGEYSKGNLFASSFLRKDKNHLTHCSISKYNAGQETRIETPEFSGTSKGKVPKLSAGKRVTNSVCGGKTIILQCRPPTDAGGIKD